MKRLDCRIENLHTLVIRTRYINKKENEIVKNIVEETGMQYFYNVEGNLVVTTHLIEQIAGFLAIIQKLGNEFDVVF